MMMFGGCEDDDDDEDLPEFAAPVMMDLVKDRYMERLHPSYWLGAARSLRYSAEIIVEHEQPYADLLREVAIGNLDGGHLKQWPKHAGAQLLYAYAFENLLKGIIIAKTPAIRNPELWGITDKDDAILKKERKRLGLSAWMTHEMKKLLQLADVRLPPVWERLLWILEATIVWRGKYPAAVSPPKSVRLDDEGIPDSILYPDPADFDLVREVFRFLENELVNLVASTPPLSGG